MDTDMVHRQMCISHSPAWSSMPTITSLPFLAAQCNGVSFLLVSASTLAPVFHIRIRLFPRPAYSSHAHDWLTSSRFEKLETQGRKAQGRSLSSKILVNVLIPQYHWYFPVSTVHCTACRPCCCNHFTCIEYLYHFIPTVMCPMQSSPLSFRHCFFVCS